jgi:hypothetical protein
MTQESLQPHWRGTYVDSVVSSARKRAARIPSLLFGPACPSALVDGRLSTSSAGNPLIMAPFQDQTAKHFYDYCKSQAYEVDWICPDDLAWGRVSCSHLSRLCNNASGIYLRETAHATNQELALASCFRALAYAHPNVIGKAYRSTNWSKPLHLMRLSGDTNVDNGSIVDFGIAASCYESGSAVIRKGMSGIPSFVELLEPNKTHEFDDVALFQPHLRGDEIRIHVIDGHVVAHKLKKRDGNVDYRISGLAGIERYYLNDQMARFFSELSLREGLRFSGADAILEDGKLRILEVNPMPGYNSFETQCGRPYDISDKLFEALSQNVL